MKRIRLLQLVHGYPPAVGGVEFAVRDMCERLVADHGFDVTVLTTDAFTVASFQDASLPRVPIDPDEVQQGVRVLRFPRPFAAVRRWTRRRVRALTLALASLPRVRRRMSV